MNNVLRYGSIDVFFERLKFIELLKKVLYIFNVFTENS